jgi:hypothetical protein
MVAGPFPEYSGMLPALGIVGGVMVGAALLARAVHVAQWRLAQGRLARGRLAPERVRRGRKPSVPTD